MIQVEQTPNPNTLKFLPGKKVSNSGPYEITNKEDMNYLKEKGISAFLIGESLMRGSF